MKLLCYLRLHKKEPKLMNYVGGDLLTVRAFIYCNRCDCFLAPCDIERWDMKEKKRIEMYSITWSLRNNDKTL